MAGIVVENQQGLMGRNMRVGLSVLVVDDDPSTLLIAERILTTKQYNVTTAIGGREALRLLKIGQFDLILSDLYMPGMDGFQLVAAVKAIYNIPFLLMSSDHRLDIMERGLEAGARFFYQKPLTVMDYENIWQFVYIENVEYFEAINNTDEGHQGPPPPPPPPPSPPQDRRPNSLSIRDHIRRHGRRSSSSSNTSNGKKRRSHQDEDHGNQKQKRPYKKRERKEDQDFGEETAVVPLKKTRVVWTTELHENFLQALSILKMAHKRDVPKRIQALMKVRGLRRANIASHLQKYRLYQNKYKGISESDYPRRRIRMRLPNKTEYHDYSPSHDHSYEYQNRAQIPSKLANQPRLRVQENLCPHNFNRVPSNHPQYQFKEGSNDNFMAQANYGHPTAVTNPGYLGRPWMSGAPTMNLSNVGTYQSLFGSSAPHDNDVNIGSTTNAIMAEQKITQGMPPGFLPNGPIDSNFGNLGFESLQNSPPSVDIENIAPLGAWNGILSGTIGAEMPNNDNNVDISRMDEIRKGIKPVEKEEGQDGFSFPRDPLYLNGMNSNFTSQGESFVVNPNCVTTVGESSTGALMNQNQQGNEVNTSDWFNSVNDIADFDLFNQASEKANEEEDGGGYVNFDEFDPWGFLLDGDNNPGAI